MRRNRCQLAGALAVLLLVLTTGCGDGDDDGPTAASTAPSTGGTATSVEGQAPPQQPAVPYLLLEAPGWTLTGGTTDVAGRDDRLGSIWTAAYESRPAPDRSIGASLMIADVTRNPDDFARDLGPQPSPATVNGVPAVAVEERSAAGGHLVATHVLWNLEGFLAALTVYELGTAEAVALAQNVRPVDEAQWRASVDGANAERADD